MLQDCGYSYCIVNRLQLTYAHSCNVMGMPQAGMKLAGWSGGEEGGQGEATVSKI